MTGKQTMDRRELLGSACLGAGALWMGTRAAQADPQDRSSESAAQPPLIDTHVSLFQWPFRRLPLDEPAKLVARLRQLGVQQAWASSFAGLLHRDLAAANLQLTEACQQFPELVAIGVVNPALPGWLADVRLCDETLKMPGVRLFPSFHGYALSDERVERLLDEAAQRGLLVQVAVQLEDPRTQPSLVRTTAVDLGPLPELLKRRPHLRVQLLGAALREIDNQLAKTPNACFDTSRMDGTDAVARLVQRVGAERALLGSHAPFLIPDSAVIRVRESTLGATGLGADAVLAVCHGNAKRLLGSRKATGAPPPERDAPAPKRGAPALSWGLPPRAELQSLRIWDSYFTPSHSHPGRDGKRLLEDIERALPAADLGCFEKLCLFLHVGAGTTGDAALEAELQAHEQLVLAPLRRWPDRLIGMIQLDAKNLRTAMAAVDRWMGDGPMRGVYFPGGGPGATACTHENFRPLVRRIGELRGVIMQHTWYKTGGKQGPGESTPAELAELARQFPDQAFICAHAGGEWEQGIRAVREQPNVLVETSGFDATAGFIEMAVRELGAARIIFGSHLPSRSLGTELGKVLAADITQDEKRQILGGNFRRLLGAS
ncbi:MAG: amidohydrolase family protein [Planctomycetales bacterium]|nr:amidohydrolase family protein [Planctomycetales bacterium]